MTFLKTTQSTTTAALVAAMSKLQSELKNPSKNKQGYGYKYADLPSILDDIKPLLAKYELVLLQLPISEIVDGKFYMGYESQIRHKDEFISSVFMVPETFVEKGKMSFIQAMGSIKTYLRRYIIGDLCFIAQDDDTDGAVARDAQPSSFKPISAPKVSVPTLNTMMDLVEKNPEAKTRLQSYMLNKDIATYRDLPEDVAQKFIQSLNHA